VAAAAAQALAPKDVEIKGGGSNGDDDDGNGNNGAEVKGASIVIPRAQVTPHRGDVRSSEYGVPFFKGFDLILNGLDNVAARRHVNRLALAAGVPLVESGTAGHLGQVTVHFKNLRDGLTLRQQREAKEAEKDKEQKEEENEGKDISISTECYECSTKPTPKSFPVCTIRSTPEKPIHCVVWAKELMFARLLGPPDAVSDLEKGGRGGGEGDGDVEKKEGEGGGEDKSLPSLLRAEGESASSYAARVYSRLFDSDVREAAALDELWESRPRPAPLPLGALLLGLAEEEGAAEGDPTLLAAEVEEIERAVVDKAAAATSTSTSTSSPSSSSSNLSTSFSAARALGLANDHARWPVASWARLFVGALAAFHALRPSEVGAACFDKDDRLGCELVCAGAALRAAAYRVGSGGGGGGAGAGSGSGGAIGSIGPIAPPPPITVFDAKGMAGNIVHALATTNAVVAGLIVAEALKLVSGAVSACKVTWIRAVGSSTGGGSGGGRLLVAGPPPAPAAGCAVCGSARLELECDPATFTLAELVDNALKGRLALIAPTLICGGGGGGFYWEDPSPSNGECDLDADELEQYSRLLPLALGSLPGGGFGAGTVVAVKDQAQAIDLHLLIVEKKKKREEEGGEKKEGEKEEEEEARFVLRGAAPVAAEEEDKEKIKAAASPSSSSDLEILPDAEAGKEVPAVEPEVPDAVDAAEALAAEEARERKEAAAVAVAAATATAATEEKEPASAAAAEEEEEEPEAEQQQPSAAAEEEEDQQEPPPPTKRPRRAAADRGRETVREALRENAKGGRGDRKRRTKVREED